MIFAQSLCFGEAIMAFLIYFIIIKVLSTTATLPNVNDLIKYILTCIQMDSSLLCQSN